MQEVSLQRLENDEGELFQVLLIGRLAQLGADAVKSLLQGLVEVIAAGGGVTLAEAMAQAGDECSVETKPLSQVLWDLELDKREGCF